MGHPKEADEKRLHAWAVIGYDYKSQRYFYDTGNSNGKMNQKTYIKLLEAECSNWSQDIILEEDNDSGHGPSEKNPVRKWKEQHHLQHYFNCAHSPDLAPIENAWQAPKAYLRKSAHWNDDTIRQLAEEGWAALSRRTINTWILEMPIRLKRCIEGNGQITGY